MKRTILFAFCAMIFATTSAQQPHSKRLKEIALQLKTAINYKQPTQHTERDAAVIIPPITIDFTGHHLIMEAKRDVLTTTPVTFKFIDMFSTLDEIAASFVSRLTTPADMRKSREELIDMTMEFIKFQSHWVNNQLSPNYPWGSDLVMASRKYDIMGALFSQWSTQCGDFAKMAAYILTATHYFTSNDFRFVSFNGSIPLDVTGHSLVEINLEGPTGIWYFSIHDFDPGEMGTYFPYAGSPNGRASAWDLHNHPELAVRAYYNGQPWMAGYPESQYQAIFVVDTPHIGMSGFEPADTTEWQREINRFTIPGNSTLTAHIEDPVGYIDVEDSVEASKVAASFNYYQAMYDSGQVEYYDSIRVLFVHLFNAAHITDIDALLEHGKFKIYKSGSDQGKIIAWDYDRMYTPQPNLKISTGTADSLSVPLVALSVDKPIQFSDSIGPFSFELWTGSDTPLWTDRTSFMYTHVMAQPNTTFTCLVNSHIIGATNEWQLEILQGDAPTFTTVLTYADTVVAPTEVGEIDEPLVQLFPNPSTGRVYCSENGLLYSIDGKLVAEIRKGWNPFQLQPGIYVAHIANVTKKIILQ